MRTLLVAPLMLVLAIPAAAQLTDALDRARALQEIAIQKFESEIASAILDAEQLKATAPAQAAARLRGVLLQLDADTLLPPTKRREFTQRLQDAIVAVERPQAAPAAVIPIGRAELEAQSQAERERETRSQEEAEQIRRTLEAIGNFHKDGRYVEAERLAADLTTRYPDHPAAQSMSRQLDLASRLQEAQTLLADYERRFDLAMRDIDKSALPAIDDVEFPEDWHERTKGRTNNMLSEKEQQLLQALEQPVTLTLNQLPFAQVIQDLSDRLGEPILMDKASLQIAQIDTNMPVTLNLREVSLRTALRKILQDQGLTYIIRNETIEVTTPEKASQTLVTQVYYLGDLVRGTTTTFNPFIDQALAIENARLIADTITNSVDPLSWEGQGGIGSVRFHAPTLSLIVRQTAEVHSVLQGKFAK